MALMDIPGLAPTIASVARVLRPGGWFVFSIVPSVLSAGTSIIVTDYLLDHRYQKRIPPDWLPTHAYHRPLGTYLSELARVGFHIERVVEAHHREADSGGVPGLLYARVVKEQVPGISQPRGSTKNAIATY